MAKNYLTTRQPRERRKLSPNELQRRADQRQQSYLTARQLRERFSISDMTLWRWRKALELGFPAPLVIRRRRYWSLADIEAWEGKQAGEAA